MRAGSAWPTISHWHFTPISLCCFLLAVLFLFVRRFNRRSRLFWSLGLISLGALLSSDIQIQAMSSYRCHMIEHLIVIALIAPLFSRATNLHFSKSVATVSFLLLTILVPAFHLSKLGGVVMNAPSGHFVELASFLLAGVFFWTPIYSSRSDFTPLQKLTYIALSVPILFTTGLVLWSSSISTLSTTTMSMNMLTLSDVHNGGVVMMQLGTTLMVGHLILNTVNVYTREKQRARPIGQRQVSA